MEDELRLERRITMKPTTIFALSLPLLAGVAGTSHAQTTPDKPFSARLSIILPTQGAARSLVGRSSGQIGVSYGLAPLKGFAPRIDLDYGRFAKHGNRIEPITLQAVGLVPIDRRTGLERGPYVGAGIGLANTRLRANGFSAGLPVTFSASKTNIAGKVFAGFNFTPVVFGEIGYSAYGKVSGVDPSNVFIQIGARF